MSVLAWSLCYGGFGEQSICFWQTSDSLQWGKCTAVAATTRHLGVTRDHFAALSIGRQLRWPGHRFSWSGSNSGVIIRHTRELSACLLCALSCPAHCRAIEHTCAVSRTDGSNSNRSAYPRHCSYMLNTLAYSTPLMFAPCLTIFMHLLFRASTALQEHAVQQWAL